jgi:xanthine/CO dehydrogenase XdhC/CoxF family maturation factor
MDLMAKLQELANTGRAAALCTIVETSGSTPRKSGSKMIVTAEIAISIMARIIDTKNA